MSFLARFLRPRAAPTEPGAEPDPGPADVPEPPRPAAPPPQPAGIACPSCARMIQPAPVRSRKCPHCRRPIVVRRTGGRAVYLTEAAVEVFEAERQREADAVSWTGERAGWLRHALHVGASPERRDRIAAKPVSAASVAEARALYLAAATKAIKAATRAGDWDVVARIGRDQATALYREAGSPVPVPDAIAAVHATAMAALLRSLKPLGTHAEIVGGTCCPACRADDARLFPIADELRTPRLPHAGCPRGLCPCEWWIGMTPPKRRRRRASSA